MYIGSTDKYGLHHCVYEVSDNSVDEYMAGSGEKITITINKDGSVTVEDDGPGIPEAAADALLQRGMRLDESAPGHGIGLAVVKEIAASYGGEVEISKSDLGGARITVTVSPAKTT